MSDYLLFLVLGLSLGAVYAALSVGIVLTYMGTGILNFAAGAMATVALYVFNSLQSGYLTLPLPWIPSFHIQVLPTWLDVVIAVAVSSAIGALVHLVVSRPLRGAPALAKVVASVGVMVTLQAAVGLKYGSAAVLPSSLLPTTTVKVAGAALPVSGLLLFAIAVALGGVVALWLKRSRAGLGIRAAAENELGASFARLSPGRLGLLTWTLSAAFSALVLVLAGPSAGVIQPDTLTLLIVPALAAALFARLRSITLAVVGALLVGILQSELQFLSQSESWWPTWAQQGVTDAVPFLVVVIILFAFGRKIPMRGDEVVAKLPAVLLPTNRLRTVAIATALGVIALVATSGTYRFGVITSMAIAFIALSLVLLTGMTGQISLAQAGFAGLGGFLVFKIGIAIPFPLSLLVAVLVSAAAGLVVGLPALRIRGVQLAVVTLAAGLAMQSFVFGNPSLVSPTDDAVPSPSLFGLNLAVQSGYDIARIQFGLMVLVLLVAACVLAGNLMRGSAGRKMLAIRSNERAASSMGISVPAVKLSVFALASLLASLGGALLCYSRGQFSSESYTVFVGLTFVAVAYMGGITSVSGSLVAGALGLLGVAYVIINQHFALGEYYDLFSGLALIATVLGNPVGIAGKTRSDFNRLRAWLRRWRIPGSDQAANSSPVRQPHFAS
jgi:branched-subunit amino acid ABC-type transport system permease component